MQDHMFLCTYTAGITWAAQTPGFSQSFASNVSFGTLDRAQVCALQAALVLDVLSLIYDCQIVATEISQSFAGGQISGNGSSIV